MLKPFIRNHQFNVIKKQVGILQQAFRSGVDPKVLDAAKYSVETKVLELFPNSSDLEKEWLQKVVTLDKTEDMTSYLHSLEPYLMEFPQVTEKVLKKLFPKNKKLRIPDLTEIDYRKLTYLSWLDISLNKMFFVYPLDDQMIGVEGKFTPANKKDVCSLCHGYGEVALVTAITKSRPAGASSDYYKAVGNYMCTNSVECNKNITDVTYLERFLHTVLG